MDRPYSYPYPYPQQSRFNPQEEAKRSFDACKKRGAFHQYNVYHLEQCPRLTTDERDRYSPRNRKVLTKEQRQLASLREKNRMHTIKESFDLLKNKLPGEEHKFPGKLSLSRIEILNRAIAYIKWLTLTKELSTTSNMSGRSVSGNNSMTLTDVLRFPSTPSGPVVGLQPLDLSDYLPLSQVGPGAFQPDGCARFAEQAKKPHEHNHGAF